MRKIIDYKVVRARNGDDIGSAVVREFDYGWSPLGSVAVAINPEGNYAYAQAMVKYEEDILVDNRSAGQKMMDDFINNPNDYTTEEVSDTNTWGFFISIADKWYRLVKKEKSDMERLKEFYR